MLFKSRVGKKIKEKQFSCFTLIIIAINVCILSIFGVYFSWVALKISRAIQHTLMCTNVALFLFWPLGIFISSNGFHVVFTHTISLPLLPLYLSLSISIFCAIIVFLRVFFFGFWLRHEWKVLIWKFPAKRLTMNK